MTPDEANGLHKQLDEVYALDNWWAIHRYTSGSIANQPNGAATIFPELTTPPDINEAFAQFQEAIPRIEGEMMNLCSVFYNKIIETEPAWETVLENEEHVLVDMRFQDTRRYTTRKLFRNPQTGGLMVNTTGHSRILNDDQIFGYAVGAGFTLLIGAFITLAGLDSILAFLGVLVLSGALGVRSWRTAKTRPYVSGVYTIEQIAFGTMDIDLSLNERADILSTTYELIVRQTAGYTEASLQAAKRYNKLLT